MSAAWAGFVFHRAPPCGCPGGPFSHACYQEGTLAIAECAECSAVFAAEKDSPEAVEFADGIMADGETWEIPGLGGL